MGSTADFVQRTLSAPHTQVPTCHGVIRRTKPEGTGHPLNPSSKVGGPTASNIFGRPENTSYQLLVL